MTGGAQAARVRRLALPALVVALALSLSACAMGPEVFGQGGPDPDSSASPHPGGVGDDSTDDPGGEPGTGGEATLPVVGTIEVKVERGESAPHLFLLEATECSVSRDAVTAVSVGAGASGEGAGIVVDTVFGSVLHEGTQTITASGSIVLTIVGGERWTSDGRLDDQYGPTLPSMFEYRVDGGYAEFRTAWFGEDGARSAGFVHIHCEQ